MKRTFFIFLSIFFSICWLTSHRSFSSVQQMKTVGKVAPKLESYPLALIPTPTRFIQFPYVKQPDPPTTIASVPRIFTPKASRSAPRVQPAQQLAMVTTTTTAPVHIVRVASTYTSSCYYHTMSISQAHSCWDGLIDSYPWPHYQAFNIMYCESTGKSNAHNASGANGLMQVMGGSFDPATNMSEAYYNKWKPTHDWRLWSCGA